MAYKIFKPELNHQIKGVLFDMDGLLLDTERLYVENWIVASKEMGFPMTFQETLGLRSLNLVERQRYLESIKGPLIQDEPIRLRMDELTHKHIRDFGATPKKGAIELLKFLKENNIPCAVTSSTVKEQIIKNLKPIGLDTYFTKICSAHECKQGKPYPDIYLYGAEKLGLNPSDCLALEDSPTGILSAFRANTMPVVIPDLDIPGEETMAISYARADSLLDIIELIRWNNGL